MLKVSWKILAQSEIDAQNFHMVDALVLMPVDPRMPADDREAKRPCLPETLGLIGFHAVHKTASRPQWIWTSFEHVKNVPDKDQVAAKTFDGPYNFFNANCRDDCPVNETPPRQFWQPDYALKLNFKDSRFKSQIVRETPLTHATSNMNTLFQSMLQDSVWKNYMLVNTQWPSLFDGCTALHSPSAEAPAPKTRFSEAAGHELFARADLHGEFDTGNLQPGRDSAGVVKLHRLSWQCGGLSKRRIEPKAW